MIGSDVELFFDNENCEFKRKNKTNSAGYFFKYFKDNNRHSVIAANKYFRLRKEKGVYEIAAERYSRFSINSSEELIEKDGVFSYVEDSSGYNCYWLYPSSKIGVYYDFSNVSSFQGSVDSISIDFLDNIQKAHLNLNIRKMPGRKTLFNYKGWIFDEKYLAVKGVETEKIILEIENIHAKPIPIACERELPFLKKSNNCFIYFSEWLSYKGEDFSIYLK